VIVTFPPAASESSFAEIFGSVNFRGHTWSHKSV